MEINNWNLKHKKKNTNYDCTKNNEIGRNSQNTYRIIMLITMKYYLKKF